ncbi:MAG: chorismate lyase [Pseudomonadota bacterium]
MISSWRYARYQRKAGYVLHGRVLHGIAHRVRPTLNALPLTPEIKLYSSLTKALRKRHQSLSIQVLDQGWRPCTALDRRFIAPYNCSGQSRRLVWTRHVIIYVGNTPILYARTLWLSQGRQPGWLNTLGSKSLGDEIFKRRHGRRLWMTIHKERPFESHKPQANTTDIFKKNVKNAPAGSFMIARRSELKCQNSHFLLTEYFLEKNVHNNN